MRLQAKQISNEVNGVPMSDLFDITNIIVVQKMKCDVSLMIDHHAAEKRMTTR